MIKVRKTTKREKLDFKDSVITITLGTHETCLTQKDIDYLLSKLNDLRLGGIIKSVCPRCNGSGEITTSHEFKHCKMCNGSGKTGL